MTKAGQGTRKYRPAATFKVKLTKRNVKRMLNRNANAIPTRYGLAIKRLAPMVSKVGDTRPGRMAVMAAKEEGCHAPLPLSPPPKRDSDSKGR